MSSPLHVKEGQMFGHLTVLEDGITRDRWGHRDVLCECSCGTICTMRRTDLVSGHTRSCGCQRGKKQVEWRT